ncbi:NERD domain-containing protein [Peribacillus kribbensis]|uniref:NERD domain-containing protein n=1 Tax=Peribacillus kribbensis TaxID=356658 RepID=UPI000425A32C|nr:NERD domain-containing protein [Peribacillus kribbensis]
MGQLIKLQDYVSRYEQDIYRYPAQFVRLKTQQWTQVKAAFLAGELEGYLAGREPEEPAAEEEEKPHGNVLSRFFSRFRPLEPEDTPLQEEKKEEESEPGMDIRLSLPSMGTDLEDLKRSFLNQVFKFQLKWVSSTAREKSFIDQVYYFDEKLKLFLQRFPDNFLVLYKPIFIIKNAPVELEIILISPTEALCLSFIEGEEDAAYLGSKERFWTKKYKQNPEKKILNPIMAASRTYAVVQGIFTANGIDLPVKKAVLCRNGYIDYPAAPYDIHIVDKRNYGQWLEKTRTHSSPIKGMQLKAAQCLLESCQTTYLSRAGWEESTSSGNDNGEEA